jgi:hypothetical protein
VYRELMKKFETLDLGERYREAALATWHSGAACAKRMLEVTPESL